MLVVARRENEAIVFPQQGIRVNVVRVTGSTVRLGVEAPRDVKVLREELIENGCAPPNSHSDREAQHSLRNAMSRFNLALHLSRKQLACGQTAEAEATLALAQDALESMNRQQHPQYVTGKTSPCCKALIVEDDANERELLAELLRMYGCECVTASDGEMALSYLANGVKPDVVLLDMLMPRCDGPEMIRRLRADSHFNRLRVLTVSGTDPRSFGINIGPGGVDAWFQKPLNPARLWEAIQESTASAAVRN